MNLRMDLTPGLVQTMTCTACGKAMEKDDRRADGDDIKRISAGARDLHNPELDQQFHLCPKCGKWTNNPKLLIGNVIRWLVKERKWGPDAAEVNRGNCDQFAIEVQEMLVGAVDDISESCTELCEGRGLGGEVIRPSETLPGHVWIEHDGFSYDSECPEGVDDWRDLPIFFGIRIDP